MKQPQKRKKHHGQQAGALPAAVQGAQGRGHQVATAGATWSCGARACSSDASPALPSPQLTCGVTPLAPAPGEGPFMGKPGSELFQQAALSLKPRVFFP